MRHINISVCLGDFYWQRTCLYLLQIRRGGTLSTHRNVPILAFEKKRSCGDSTVLLNLLSGLRMMVRKSSISSFLWKSTLPNEWTCRIFLASVFALLLIFQHLWNKLIPCVKMNVDLCYFPKLIWGKSELDRTLRHSVSNDPLIINCMPN